MSKKRHTLQSKINSFLYDHIWLKYIIEYGVAFFISVLSAAIFAFGVICFLKPGASNYEFTELISGGSSGLAQVIALIFTLCGISIENNPNLIFSLAYLLINVPLIILAFFGVGKRFALFTLVNVGFVFLFSNIFKGEFFEQIAIFVDARGGLISRALFAGLCTGLSSAIAYKWETSAGGFDIVAYYLSLRKSTTAGKYSVMINAAIMVTFVLLNALSHTPTIIEVGGDSFTVSSWAAAISVIFFSTVYLFTVMLVIDLINVRNKKVQIQIITSNTDLPRLLLANVPHGATIVNATGAFSGQERKIIYMVVSSLELKKVITLIEQLDPNSFVNVTPLQQVYGRFFTRPIR